MLRVAAIGVLMWMMLCAPLQAAQTLTHGEYSFDFGTTPDWVEKRSIPAAWDQTAPGATGESWRYWLLDFQSDHRHGKRNRYFDYAYEAVSSEMISEAAKIDIDFFPEFQHLTIHSISLRRDGHWQDRFDPKGVTLARRESNFEQNMTTGSVTALFVLEDIRAGDVVRVCYSIDGENPILTGLDDERVVFATNSAILDRSARVLSDANTKLTVRRINDAPQPSEDQVRDFRELKASLHGIAALHNEGSYPLWFWAAPELVIAEQRDWSKVAEWARSLYPQHKPLPEDLQHDIAVWKKLGRVDDRISAALQAVQEKVRYFGTEIGENTHRPAEPADTWNHRYGDCKDKARLLAAILDGLGIEAHPALVSAAHERGVADLPPAASAFDHVIVQVQLQGEVLWLDPTATQQRGPLRGLDRGDFGMALPVAPGIRDLVVMPPPLAIDNVRTRERFTPAADGKVALDVETRFSGYAAERMRRALQTQAKDEVDRHYADFYRKRYGELVVTHAVDIQRSDTENAVIVNEAYLLSNPWVGNTPASRTIDLYADMIGERAALPKTMQRKAPLAISHPSDIEQDVEFVLPKGWQWRGQGATKTIDDTFIHYERNIRESEKLVQLSQHYTARRDADDAEGANKHLQQLRELNELLDQRIVFVLPEQDAEKQRRQRLEGVMRNLLDQNSERKDAKH